MDRSPRPGERSSPETTTDPIPVDAERPIEVSDDATEVTPPVDAPIEAPIDDLVEQRRAVRLEDPDEH